MNREIENIITMVGCNRKEFLELIKNVEGKISMSSGSQYSDFWIFAGIKLIAKYDYKGKLIMAA